MRIVSLVPSLTKTLADLGLPKEQLVGRTPWCIHPEEYVLDVPVIGGTKTPNIGKIVALQPDLVIMDKEENPLEVFNQLKENGIEPFVSKVESPEDVPDMLRLLGEKINCKQKGEEFAMAIEHELGQKTERSGPKVAAMIWHDPLMCVSPTRYSGALLERCGFIVPDFEPNGNGYPVVTTKHLIDHLIEGLLLSSEPHNFAIEEGEAISEKVVQEGGPNIWNVCIDGEALTWFGTHTLHGLKVFKALCEDLKMSAP
jgi:ABC-type Fe3+-hydroxamate transport system substrate-binding protein